MTKTALISGSGIAGPTVAYWLARAGWDCTVVERFPELRSAGQNVDIRGAAREVVRRMGLGDAVAAHGTGEVGTRFVGGDGRALAEFPEDGTSAGGGTAEWEILRGQLSRLLFDATAGSVTYRFGASIAEISDRETDAAAHVRFDDGTSVDVDAVIVAEGIGSRTRALIGDGPGEGLTDGFGQVRRRDLGVTIAYFSIPRAPGDDQWWNWYNAAGGRSITLRPDNVGRTRVTLSFRSDPVASAFPSRAEIDAMLRARFADAGWQTQRILDQLDDVDDLYLDDIGQVIADRWSSGHIALVGDAAYCPSPVSGMGTSLAMTGAYVLAHALAERADARAAFAQYEQTMRPFVAKAQKLPPGAPGIMHPRSRAGLALLRTAFRLAGSGVLRPFERTLFHPPADRLRLPEWRVPA